MNQHTFRSSVLTPSIRCLSSSCESCCSPPPNCGKRCISLFNKRVGLNTSHLEDCSSVSVEARISVRLPHLPSSPSSMGCNKQNTLNWSSYAHSSEKINEPIYFTLPAQVTVDNITPKFGTWKCGGLLYWGPWRMCKGRLQRQASLSIGAPLRNLEGGSYTGYFERWMNDSSRNGASLSEGALWEKPGERATLLGTRKVMLSKALEMDVRFRRENMEGHSFPTTFERREKFLSLGKFLLGIWEICKKMPCKRAALSIGALLGVHLLGLLRVKENAYLGSLFLDPEDIKS